jgi:hypothetical protein
VRDAQKKRGDERDPIGQGREIHAFDDNRPRIVTSAFGLPGRPS